MVLFSHLGCCSSFLIGSPASCLVPLQSILHGEATVFPFAGKNVFYCGNTHIKFAVLTIFKCPFRKYIHVVMQPVSVLLSLTKLRLCAH